MMKQLLNLKSKIVHYKSRFNLLRTIFLGLSIVIIDSIYLITLLAPGGESNGSKLELFLIVVILNCVYIFVNYTNLVVLCKIIKNKDNID